MQYVLIALIGYLCGIANPAYFLAKAKGIDIKSRGSGNAGASNAMTLMGWKAGIFVALFDIGKAICAVLLSRALMPSAALAGIVGGVACVMGHMFPFYLRFRGGKGLASYLGMALALNWKFALLLFLAVAVLTLVTDYIVIGTMTTIVAAPIYFAWTQSVTAALILCIASLTMIYKHRDNLARICKGTEIGLRSANRGDHRADQ